MADKPWRILQVIETGGPGGAETVFARLSGGLRARGHEVHGVVRDGSWLPDELRRRELPFDTMPSGSSVDFRLLRFLRDRIRATRAQIVHAHLFDGAIYAALAARLEGVPCVATLHGQVDVQAPGLKTRIKQWLFARAVQRVVAVSDMLRRELQLGLALPPERFVVVPNGVPLTGQSFERPLGSKRRHRLIAIGNIRKPKDYPTLLAAMARVRQAIPDVHLDIVGQPDRENELQGVLVEQVQSFALEPHVTFHGFVADPTGLLRAADCFVLSSSQEGFSLATIEAMLARVPVVATRSGGPEEILEHEATGILVPARNPDALAEGILRVLNDDELSDRLTRNAATVAATRFSESAMVQAYESLYGDLIGR